MAKIFLNLPVPPAAGVGAAVNTSALGALYTIVVGSFTGGGTITIEGSADGVNFSQLVTFQEGDKKQINVAAQFMRVRRSANVMGVPNVDVGSDDSGGMFAVIPLPAFTGPGAAVDVSAFGSFTSFYVFGELGRASFTIEVSNDGIDWGPCVGFNLAGVKSRTVNERFVRVNVQGRIATAPFTAAVSVGAINDPITIAGDTGISFLPDSWEMQDLPLGLVNAPLFSSVSQLFDNLEMNRPGSLVGFVVRLANGPILASDITATVTINGVLTALTLFMDSVSNSNGGRAIAAPGAIPYVAGDFIGVVVSTGGNLNPGDTIDIGTWVEVEQ